MSQSDTIPIRAQEEFLEEILEETQIVTFGCRLNSFESQLIRELSTKADLKGAIVVNTCAVTGEAERQARQEIRKIRRKNPKAQIIVTGCAAQINPEAFAAMPEVDRILGNREKLQLESYVQAKEKTPSPSENIVISDIMELEETAGHFPLISGFDQKARAFVQVQNGCDHRCTFCIIPYGRGNSRSVPIGDIVEQISLLVTNGYQEIVLTGVDLTAYGADLPGKPTLGQMVRRLLRLVPQLARLRLSSLDPVEVDEDLWQAIEEEERLMPHLHISLQAGDDMILKRMKRRHLRQDVIDFCNRARSLRPSVTFGADIIVGFPTETEEMFQNSLALVETCQLTYLHVFPFSPRPGVPASRMPQVPKPLIKERAKRLRDAGDKALSCFLNGHLLQEVLESPVQKTQKIVPVLVESSKDAIFFGKTPEFASVRFNVDTESPAVSKNIIGSIVSVAITHTSTTELIGVMYS